jgi:medium-chain acyl-[acyl-carrier-protein] hydrolase
MKYTERYKAKWHDTDACGRVRPSELLTYMQETANRQFVSAGRDLDGERDSAGVGFILSKIALDFNKPLFAYDDIEVETFTCDSRGFSFNRGFRILKNGEEVARAASVWALVDVKEGKLIKVNDYSVGFENEPMPETVSPMRIKMPPAESFVSVGKRTIVYSDIDYNMHMNNTRYPNMLCDFMELSDTDRIAGMSLSYLHEAALGDTLEVLCAKTEENYFFKTLGEDGKVCLEAMVRLG